MATEIAELSALITRLRAGLERMLELLEQESRCLEVRDAAGLERVAGEKSVLAPVLDALSVRHRAYLDAAEAGLQCLLDQARGSEAERESLGAEWREIIRLTRACRRQNGINGAYIGLLRRHVDTSLEILGAAAGRGATYGPDGVERLPAPSRHSYSV